MSGRSSNGWCKKRKNPSGKIRWRAGYRALDGSRPTETFDTETEGWDWIRGELANQGVLKALGADPAAAKEPLSKWWNEANGLRVLKPKTRSDIDSIGRNWVLPYIGDIAVGAFSNVKVLDKWVGRIRADGCKEPTIHKAVSYLKPVLNYAVECGALARNSASRYKRAKKPPRKPIHALEAEQVWQLADVIGEQHRTLVLVLGMQGLRFGEAAALRVSDFNPKAGTVDVTKNVVDVRGSGIIEQDSTKSGKPRTIPLYPSVIVELEAHVRRLRVATKPDALLFPNEDGGFLSVNNFGRPGRALMKAARAVGLPSGFTIHWLRHTAATVAIDIGCTPQEVCDLLGHWDPAFTMSVYGHRFENRMKDRLATGDATIQAARFGEASNVVAMSGRS